VTTWELPTASTAYTVAATDTGLELVHWGRPVRVVPGRTSLETPADVAPLEPAAAGTRHVQVSELPCPSGRAREWACWRGRGLVSAPPAEVDLPAGQLSLGSRQGITSHTYAPVVTLRSREPGASDAYGIARAWSGSWRLAADAVPFCEVVRVSGGPDDETV
jgi:hypothetical protein